MSTLTTTPIPLRAERNPRLLAQFTLTTNDASVYTVPSDRVAFVSAIVICNTHTSATTFRVHHTRPGAASAVANAQYYDARLANGATVIDETERPLLPGESLRGKAGVTGVVAVAVYGREGTA
jgi:hypothetical protein